jgi:hypothetical protein
MMALFDPLPRVQGDAILSVASKPLWSVTGLPSSAKAPVTAIEASTVNPCGSDPDIADERLHSALTDCCEDIIRLFQTLKRGAARSRGGSRGQFCHQKLWQGNRAGRRGSAWGPQPAVPNKPPIRPTGKLSANPGA